MRLLLRRFAAVLLIVAAVANGLSGPWAHGHAMAMGTSGHSFQPFTAPAGHAEHDDCGMAAQEDVQAKHPTGHSHGSAPTDAMCSGALTCCGAIVLFGLPIVEPERRVEAWAGLPPSPAGLTPPVGERPPLPLHV